MTYELTPVQLDYENHFAVDRDTFAPPRRVTEPMIQSAAQDLTPGQYGHAIQRRCAGATSTTRENQ